MTLYEFYGEECPHCENMEPKVEQLQEEEDIEIEQREVWHDEENAEMMDKYDEGFCGGVPFFYNTESEEWICGETSLENLKAWAKGEAV